MENSISREEIIEGKRLDPDLKIIRDWLEKFLNRNSKIQSTMGFAPIEMQIFLYYIYCSYFRLKHYWKLARRNQYFLLFSSVRRFLLRLLFGFLSHQGSRPGKLLLDPLSQNPLVAKQIQHCLTKVYLSMMLFFPWIGIVALNFLVYLVVFGAMSTYYLGLFVKFVTSFRSGKQI